MGAPGLVSGSLPMGRWTVTEAEAKALCGTPDGKLREEIWQEWETLTAAVRSCVGEVAACWLGGSFFTSKAAPADLDCVYVIDNVLLANARTDANRAAFLQIVATKDAVKTQFHLRLDTFILDWMPHPGVDPGTVYRQRDYLAMRGYWDDLWCRMRDPIPRLEAIPRRGYLEVILDGYK